MMIIGYIDLDEINNCANSPLLYHEKVIIEWMLSSWKSHLSNLYGNRITWLDRPIII